MSTTTLKGYARYVLSYDAAGNPVITNKATGDVLQSRMALRTPEYYQLTNDKGERKRVYVRDLPEAPKPAPAAPKEKATHKMSQSDADAIRAARAAGQKVNDLAALYKVHRSTINDIMIGRIYNPDGAIPYTMTKRDKGYAKAKG